MFTEAVFESVLAEYTKEGIDVGGMSFEVRERARVRADGCAQAGRD